MSTTNEVTPVVNLDLTDEQWKRILEHVQEEGEGRRRAQGKPMSEKEINSKIQFVVALSKTNREAALGQIERLAQTLSGQNGMHEADYIAGAMAMLQAIGGWGHLPAGWVFGPMIGRSLYDPEERNNDGR